MLITLKVGSRVLHLKQMKTSTEEKKLMKRVDKGKEKKLTLCYILHYWADHIS